MDIGVTLYELMPNGECSNKIETIPFSNTHLVVRKLRKGSRLVIYLNVNKNPFSELNYGTGKIVSEETIRDAKEPLQVKWYNDSFVKTPILRH